MNTAHNWKMFLGLALIAIIGGLQALHGSVGTTASTWVDTIVSVLLIIEHSVNGNTSTSA